MALFSRSNFENAVSQEWEGRLTWNKRDLSRQNVGAMLWLSMFTSSMTLTLDLQGQILKKSNLRNGMADWHGTKGMWVDRMLDSHCDFKLWPHPWPWPWIFKVKSGWVGLWGFLWWAPSAKGKDHHGVSSGWSSIWHRSNTGLSSTQYEQIPIILGVWPFWLTPFFFRSITFWQAYG